MSSEVFHFRCRTGPVVSGLNMYSHRGYHFCLPSIVQCRSTFPSRHRWLLPHSFVLDFSILLASSVHLTCVNHHYRIFYHLRQHSVQESHSFSTLGASICAPPLSQLSPDASSPISALVPSNPVRCVMAV
jgi:hypothetical protein